MCATECSARCHARRYGRAICVACNRARFPATRPRVFFELKIMKIVVLIYQIIQEKFANGELFMLLMKGYIFMFRMVKKMQNSGLEIVAGLTRPLIYHSSFVAKTRLNFGSLYYVASHLTCYEWPFGSNRSASAYGPCFGQAWSNVGKVLASKND